MKDPQLLRTMIGFAIAAAFFGAVDGYLLGEVVSSPVAGGAAGAAIGFLIGGALAYLAWRPMPQDAGAQVAHEGGHANYMLIFGALFLLTVIEVGVAFVAFSKVAIILILVALAFWKALLVALYYMHLKYEPKRLWLLAASPIPLAIILVTAVLMEGWR
ncbi:MAG: cytochrome C oxidase subunit IV family protein [Gemmatimonadota bacterium]